MGTAAAFAVTERLKLVRSPIAAPEIDRVFSPVCDCERDRAAIAFRLREGDRVDLQIVDGDGDVVRTLAESRSEPRRAPRGDLGRPRRRRNVVPEGAYRPRVHLARQRRTIVLPNPIEVDVTAPVAELVSVDPTVFSPDGDGRSDKVTVRYRMSEPANALLLVDGEQRVRTRFAPVDGEARLVRDRRRQAAAPRDHALQVLWRRPRRQPVAADRRRRGRPDPVDRSRAGARPCAPARPVRHRRRHGRRVVPLALRRRHRHRPRALLVLRAPVRPAATRSSSRRTAAATAPRCSSVHAELAQVGAIVGAAGLAILLLAPAGTRPAGRARRLGRQAARRSPSRWRRAGAAS